MGIQARSRIRLVRVYSQEEDAVMAAVGEMIDVARLKFYEISIS